MEDDIGRHLCILGQFLAQGAQGLEQGIPDRVGRHVAAAPAPALGRHHDLYRAFPLQDGAGRSAQRQSAMLVGHQVAARLQGPGQRLQHDGFCRFDDAEHAQPVMAALADPLVLAPGQYLLQMPHAEALPGAIDRRQQLARQFGRIGDIGLLQAIVAIAAACRRMFAEMPQQHGSAAFGRLHQSRQRVEPRPLCRPARLVHLGQPLARGGEIPRTPEHDRLTGIAVAAGTARFLVIAFDGLGHADMGDEAHIRFVDPHAEGDRGHDHHVLAGNEGALVRRAHLSIQPCVIGPHGPPGRCCQLVCQILDLAPGLGIDDPRPRLAFHQIGQLPHRIVAMADRITDIGPVEPRQYQPVLRYAELRHDIGTRLAIRRRGQRQPRHLRKSVHQAAQHPVIGTEIVAPFGYAVGLVDREQAQRRRTQEFAKGRLARPFRRDVQKIQLAGPEGILRFAPVGIGAGQRGRADAIGARAAKLIVHQRDQRADHHAGTRQHHGGQLVGQRFPRAGRHHRQRRCASQDARDDILLPTAKSVEAEDIFQGLICACDPAHRGLMADAGASATAGGQFSPCPACRACALPPARFHEGDFIMKFRIALTAAATIALAACGSTEDASTEVEADTVEMPADEALTGIEETPVADPAANTEPAPQVTSPSEEVQIQEAGDSAADTAAAAMDAMSEDSSN